MIKMPISDRVRKLLHPVAEEGDSMAKDSVVMVESALEVLEHRGLVDNPDEVLDQVERMERRAVRMDGVLTQALIELGPVVELSGHSEQEIRELVSDFVEAGRAAIAYRGQVEES